MVATEVFQDMRFHFLDYLIFWLTIAISLAIGIYYGYYKKLHEPIVDGLMHISSKNLHKIHDYFGSHHLNEHLLGSRNMHAVPVALSLFAGYISGIELLGIPEEIYYYGTQYWLILIPICMMGLIISIIYIPVYHALGVSSSYQYLGLRFHPYLDTITSLIFVVDVILFLPLVLYEPAISFNQVSGTNIHIFTFILCLSCTIYTIMGGAKAVIATSAFQTILVLLSVVFIIIYALIEDDGFHDVISKNKSSYEDRFILFNFSPSLYEHNTFWSITIGALCYWTAFNAVSQTMVQKFMCLPGTWEAQCSVSIYVAVLLPFISLCCFMGLQMYAFYSHCDPLTAGLIQDEDQIVSIFILQALGHLHTVAGIHVAGVVGASLSSLSTALNSTSAIIYENILRRFFQLKFKTAHSELLIRLIVIFLAILSFALVFFVEKLGSIFTLSTAISSIAASTTFGLITLGMLIPWSNTRGALIGAFAGFFITTWIAFGTQIVISQNLLPSFKLTRDVERCELNETIEISPEPDPSGVFPLYRISDLWISPIGIITVLTVGTIASFISGPTDPKTLDRHLISPVLHRWLPTN